MKTPMKTLQIAPDQANPADACVLVLIAENQPGRPGLADETCLGLISDGPRALVERKRTDAAVAGLRSDHNDADDLNSDDPVAAADDAPEAREPVKLWLDDLRPAPEGWLHAYTAPDAIAALAAGGAQTISLDHDLGPDEGAGTGYDVATWIEGGAADGTLARLTWAIHSANPVGRARMRAALESADRLWDRGEDGS